MLPNFLCIGAQKSGTTTLWHILNAHPDVYMAQKRETRFFYDDFQYMAGLQKYEIDYFSDWSGQAAVGEKCPEYLYVPDVAKRIRSSLGADVKLIVSLRSPAQRAFSHYRHNLMQLRESRSFETALSEEFQSIQQGQFIPPPFGYIARGFYNQQLECYWQQFDSEQLLLLHFEREIATKQRALVTKLCDFLHIGRHYPDKLPIVSGHPRLETMQVTKHEARNTEALIEIRHHASKLRSFLSGKTNSDVVQHIKQPSIELLNFASNFSLNKPKTIHLSRTEELSINQRYFQKDILALQANSDLDVMQWLT